MARKHDVHRDELEGIAQRLRDERPEASPLELDRIKTNAMSRAHAATRRGRPGPRRLVVASLAFGLLAAGTGGVIASGGTNLGKRSAAAAQYGGTCTSLSCRENSFNTAPASGNGNGVTANRKVTIRISVPRKSRLRKVTVRVNGKVVSVLKGKKVSKNVKVANLPCSATVTITAVTILSKTVTQTHTFHLC